MIRLHKYIADCGLCSRRQAEEMIREGKVEVNGAVIREEGLQIDPCKDTVLVLGKPVSFVRKQYVYVLLNKPCGYVTTMHDPQRRPTVAHLVHTKVRVFPVGRLDKDTSGLLLLTNDGDLANILMHPRHGIEKTYEVLVEGAFEGEKIQKLQRGLFIQGHRTAPAKIKLLGRNRNRARFLLTIHEGKKHQVRNMCQAVGCKVLQLKRVKYGCLTLQGLREGCWRYLSKEEVGSLTPLQRKG